MFATVKGGKTLSLVVVFCALIIQFPGVLHSQAIERGNLVGFVFDRDGTTPVPGAVVNLKNISSGAVYVSNETDRTGVFRVDGLSKGIYTYGITTPGGDFNSNELIGILANETTKISIALNTYDSVVQNAVQEVLRDQVEPSGESRIGHVLTYNPSAKDALVLVERGLLQVNDSVHVLGLSTNFKQDVSSLVIDNASVRRALVGQRTWMKVGKPAQTGDAVYVTCKKGVVPFFLSPCGLAWVVAGTGAVLYGIITTNPPTPVSPSTVIK